MLSNLKRTFAARPVRNVISLVLLIAAAAAVGPRLAQSRGRCPFCFSLQTFGENSIK
jgi:hypothetical protein